MGNSKKLGRGQPCQDLPGHLASLRSSPQSAWEVIIIITRLELAPLASFRLAQEQSGGQAGLKPWHSPFGSPERKQTLDKVYLKEVWVSQPTLTRGVRRTLHVPSENKLCKPQNTAIPGAKQVRLMIVEKANGSQKSLTERVCLTNIVRVSVNAKSSPFPGPSFLPSWIH